MTCDPGMVDDRSLVCREELDVWSLAGTDELVEGRNVDEVRELVSLLVSSALITLLAKLISEEWDLV